MSYPVHHESGNLLLLYDNSLWFLKNLFLFCFKKRMSFIKLMATCVISYAILFLRAFPYA